MANVRSSFYIDGTAVNKVVNGTYVRWVTDQHKLHASPTITIPTLTLPQRDGVLSLPAYRTTGASEWSLTVAITGRDYAEFIMAKAEMDALVAPSASSVTIREDVKNAAGQTTLQLSAEAMLTSVDVDAPWDDEDGAYVTYSFLIPSGIWTSPEVTRTVTSTGTYTVSAGGSAPQSAVTFVVYANAGSVNFRASNPDLDDAYVSLRYSADDARTSTVRSQYGYSSYASSPRPKNNSVAVEVGPQTFRIGTDGRVRIDSMSGVRSVDIKTKVAWY